MCFKTPSPPPPPEPPAPPPPRPPALARGVARLPEPTGVAEQRRSQRQMRTGTGRSKLRIELGNTSGGSGLQL